jgi:hypothetical protein
MGLSVDQSLGAGLEIEPSRVGWLDTLFDAPFQGVQPLFAQEDFPWCPVFNRCRISVDFGGHQAKRQQNRTRCRVSVLHGST